MSKKKKDKVKAKKSGKKNPDKKAIKKAAKPSPKNAAKKPSKPTNAKKAKPVVKKTSVKAAKPVKKAAKKVASSGSATKSTVAKKTAVKVISKNNKPKKVVVKKAPASKKAVVKKVISKKKEVKPPVKPSKSSSKTAPKGSSGHKPQPEKSSPPQVAKKELAKKPMVVAPAVSKKEVPAPVEKIKKTEDVSTRKQVTEKRPDVLAITNTIPVKVKHELPASKIASISSSITNPIKKTDSYAIKPEKEPNGKFELEFVVHSSAEMLYEFLSTPSGLSEWFCDDLNIRNGIYTFIWDDQLQQARLLKTVDLQVVRFQWVDKTDGSYFEFRIQRDDLTNDISLIITDFAETVSERESAKLLWHSQIEKLMHVIGSIF